MCSFIKLQDKIPGNICLYAHSLNIIASPSEPAGSSPCSSVAICNRSEHSGAVKSSLLLWFQLLMLLHAAAWMTPSFLQKLSWGGKGDCDGADSEQTSRLH